jgi:hypothetical protein
MQGIEQREARAARTPNPSDVMPLLDHFHPPLDERYPWDSLHSGWATRRADALNDRLPEGFVAAEITHAGQLEVDVASFEQYLGPPLSPAGAGPSEESSADRGRTATLTRPVYTPPAPAQSFPAVFPDTFEVRVFARSGGLTLVGAIELVSPGNKDFSQAQQAFAAKCATYVHGGVSLIVIDIVTNRRANLHNATMRLLDAPPDLDLDDRVLLYAVAYRPVLRKGRAEIDVWPVPCSLGQALPTLPLRLTGGQFVPVDFEATYLETCRRRRLL